VLGPTPGDARSVQSVRPPVVRADEPGSGTTSVRHLRAAVPAHVEHRVDGSVVVACDDDGVVADVDGGEGTWARGRGRTARPRRCVTDEPTLVLEPIRVGVGGDRDVHHRFGDVGSAAGRLMGDDPVDECLLGRDVHGFPSWGEPSERGVAQTASRTRLIALGGIWSATPSWSTTSRWSRSGCRRAAVRRCRGRRSCPTGTARERDGGTTRSPGTSTRACRRRNGARPGRGGAPGRATRRASPRSGSRARPGRTGRSTRRTPPTPSPKVLRRGDRCGPPAQGTRELHAANDRRPGHGRGEIVVEVHRCAHRVGPSCRCPILVVSMLVGPGVPRSSSVPRARLMDPEALLSLQVRGRSSTSVTGHHLIRSRAWRPRR
jgi:hypothetical protein